MSTTTITRYRRWAGLISFIVLSLLSSNTFGVVAIIGVEGTLINYDENQDHATSFTVKQNRERKLPSNNKHNFCGVGFQDASTSCKYPCPSGSIDECPAGMLCYFNTPCDIKDPTQKPTNVIPPKISPLSSNIENEAKLSFFCGKDWSDASSRCGVWCPNGEDDVCPSGQSCFGDTLCQKTTGRPTGPQPTIGPSFKPTDPTAAPSIGMMVDHPSNHQFCG